MICNMTDTCGSTVLVLWLYCIFCTSIVHGQVETKIINLDQGPVRGFKDVSRKVFAFQGIPYAMEPKGNDTFKAPLPPLKWTEILNANRNIYCPQQVDETGFKPDISENCLVANVYIPSTEVKNLPVLVIIHGGAFFAGHGEKRQPQAIVDTQKIVAVSINYRLGVHGFLCLGTESAPGNAGMKDQVAALRWVKENIAKFGGNPEDITIYGCSAGSTSVNLHMLSKMSNGLFQKVIAESASSLGAFSTQQDPISNAKSFAKRLSSTLDTDDLEALEEFYLKTPLTMLTDNILEIYGNYIVDFVPCVERDLDTERFLDASPYSILKSGDYTKVPKMEGLVDMEGLLRDFAFDKDIIEMKKDFTQFLPGDLYFESEKDKNEVTNSVREFYFGKREIGPSTSLEYFDYMSDTGFTYSILASLKLQLETGLDTLYLYQYAFVEESTPFIPYTSVKAAKHGALYSAILEDPFEQNVSIKYSKMRDTLRELWINFITTGEPVPASSSTLPLWPKAASFNSPYMLLNETLLLKTLPLLQEKFEFWDNIYRKHYREPQPPSNNGRTNIP